MRLLKILRPERFHHCFRLHLQHGNRYRLFDQRIKRIKNLDHVYVCAKVES